MQAAWSSLSTAPQMIPATQLFPGFVDRVAAAGAG
jgi:hypothetical protein